MRRCPIISTEKKDSKKKHPAAMLVEPNYREEMNELRELHSTDIRQISAAKVWMLIHGFFSDYKDKDFLDRLTMAIYKQAIEPIIDLR